MYKDYRYINAGQNEFYRWGHKAVERIEAGLEVNENGYMSIPADGGKYYTIGTSEGKYGEFAKLGDTCFSVNKGGYVYVKAGTEKAEIYKIALNKLIADMKAKHGEFAE